MVGRPLDGMIPTDPMTAPALFDPDYYLEQNPDVALMIKVGRIDGRDVSDQRGAAMHWLRHGAREGRNSHPGFHVAEYISSQPEVRQYVGSNGYEAAARHYLYMGRDLGFGGRILG